jgi:hypothetical protein
MKGRVVYARTAPLRHHWQAKGVYACKPGLCASKEEAYNLFVRHLTDDARLHSLQGRVLQELARTGAGIVKEAYVVRGPRPDMSNQGPLTTMEGPSCCASRYVHNDTGQEEFNPMTILFSAVLGRSARLHPSFRGEIQSGTRPAILGAMGFFGVMVLVVHCEGESILSFRGGSQKSPQLHGSVAVLDPRPETPLSSHEKLPDGTRCPFDEVPVRAAAQLAQTHQLYSLGMWMRDGI